MKAGFQNRSFQKEEMDDFSSQGDIITKTLKELDIINNLLGGYSVTRGGLNKLVSKHRADKLTVADIGCGGGNTLLKIKDWADKKKINVRLIGIDANASIVAKARENLDHIDNKELIHGNIFETDLSASQIDIVNCTLLVHHFNDEELDKFLRKMSETVHVGIVINDLHRHWFAYHSIRILTRCLSKSAMVINDAPLSVLRAFRRKELETMLQQAGLNNYSLKWKWAFRWQLVIWN